ncbi:MAG: hypothetical protein Q7U48_13895 [Hydrogenophaga sp.]|nr:hypothetical protein [Hydrogenophaga sp.]
MATANKNQSTVTTLDEINPETQAQEVAAAEVSESVRGANHDDALSGKKVTLTIFQGEGETGHEAVQIGVNGFMWLMPRGKPERVPVEVAEVIRNAKITSYRLGDGGRAIEYETPRFAYQITE